MKIIVGIIVFFLFSISYASESDVFGLKIGSKIQEYNDLSLIKEENIAYKKINFKGFEKLFIFYTPKKNIISKLIVFKTISQDCEEETKILVNELKPILGVFTKNNIFKEFLLENGDTKSTIYCKNKNIVLEIRNNEIEKNRNIELAQKKFLIKALIKIEEQSKAIEKLNDLTQEDKLQYLRDYRDDVYSILYKNWKRPAYSLRGWSCSARIIQNHLGVVLNVRTLNCEKDVNFEKSIKDAVLKSSPLPLPKHPSLHNKEVEVKFKVT